MTANSEYPTQTIVGVVPDIPYRGIMERHFDIYMPSTQTQHRVAYLVVRTTSDPAALARLVNLAVREVAPRAVVERIRTLEALVADAFAPIRFTMALLVALAVLGTVVAAAGVYALTAYSVNQSTPDLALRMAIGASSGALIRMTLWQTGKYGAAGLLTGSLLSVALVKRMSPLLFGVPEFDVLALATTSSLLGAMVSLAAYLAARRVTRIDPLLTMRTL